MANGNTKTKSPNPKSTKINQSGFIEIGDTKIKPAKRNAVTEAIVNENQEIQDAIRFKAYELYLERNGANGNDIEDWLTAERIVLKRFI
jgi:Protein of unknown function (DUF2934)